MMQKRIACYCAFCKNQRKVYATKHLSMVMLTSLVVLSYLLTFVVWAEPDARGLFILGVFLVVGEMFSQFKWRQSMVCKNCGFDPVLYIKNPEQAGEKIKEFMKIRSERPEFLLKPTLKLPVRRVSSKGENLSLRG